MSARQGQGRGWLAVLHHQHLRCRRSCTQKTQIMTCRSVQPSARHVLECPSGLRSVRATTGSECVLSLRMLVPTPVLHLYPCCWLPGQHDCLCVSVDGVSVDVNMFCSKNMSALPLGRDTSFDQCSIVCYHTATAHRVAMMLYMPCCGLGAQHNQCPNHHNLKVPTISHRQTTAPFPKQHELQLLP